MIRRAQHAAAALGLLLGLGGSRLICDGGCPACPPGQHIVRDCKMGDGVIMSCDCSCAPDGAGTAGSVP